MDSAESRRSRFSTLAGNSQLFVSREINLVSRDVYFVSHSKFKTLIGYFSLFIMFAIFSGLAGWLAFFQMLSIQTCGDP